MSIRRQGFRFIVVGVASNTLLYVIYLGISGVGLGHKTAMSLVYLLGVLQTFVINKAWTFAHRGHHTAAFFRYLAAYGGCYLLQLLMLCLFVDYLGVHHAIVQGVAICVVAYLLFLLQKYWVFAMPVMNAIGRAP